jgi:hypothetical protein
MAAYKSVQLTLVDGVGAERVENGDFFGRVRRDYFNYNSDTGFGSADTVELARIPKGARILGVFMCNEDFDTNGSPALAIDIGLKGTDGSGTYDSAGTADDPDLFTATPLTVLQAAVLLPANLVDNFANILYLTTKAVTVELTVETAAATLASDVELKGYVEYVVD